MRSSLLLCDPFQKRFKHFPFYFIFLNFFFSFSILLLVCKKLQQNSFISPFFTLFLLFLLSFLLTDRKKKKFNKTNSGKMKKKKIEKIKINVFHWFLFSYIFHIHTSELIKLTTFMCWKTNYPFSLQFLFILSIYLFFFAYFLFFILLHSYNFVFHKSN